MNEWWASRTLGNKVVLPAHGILLLVLPIILLVVLKFEHASKSLEGLINLDGWVLTQSF